MKPILYIGCPVPERTDTEKVLASANFSVVWADGLSAAVHELERRDMPLLVDLSRGAAALQLARELRLHRPDTLMFAVVDPKRPDLTTEAVLAGMADVFARPLGGRRIAHAIERELGYQAKGTARPAHVSEELYTYSQSMRDVLARVTKAATMRAGVVIRGEEGTGRQIVARAIHAAQGRSNASFVRVDCGALDGDRLETELFGGGRGIHGEARGLERVARQSRLRQASGGTLYLQNIADAPARVQARLARVLRDREAQLIETGEPIALDVRPMAGVDSRNDTAVQDGRVREDLYRRLSVIVIDVPPLRQRRDDIPALANLFLRQTCAAERVPPRTLSRPALSLIAALPWRGNAAELRGLLDRIVSAGGGGRGISLDDVLAHLNLDAGAAVAPARETLRQARMRFERDYVARVLDQCQWQINEAARTLGLQRTNLYRKIRTLGLRPRRAGRGSNPAGSGS